MDQISLSSPRRADRHESWFLIEEPASDC